MFNLTLKKSWQEELYLVLCWVKNTAALKGVVIQINKCWFLIVRDGWADEEI